VSRVAKHGLRTDVRDWKTISLCDMNIMTREHLYNEAYTVRLIVSHFFVSSRNLQSLDQNALPRATPPDSSPRQIVTVDVSSYPLMVGLDVCRGTATDNTPINRPSGSVTMLDWTMMCFYVLYLGEGTELASATGAGMCHAPYRRRTRCHMTNSRLPTPELHRMLHYYFKNLWGRLFWKYGAARGIHTVAAEGRGGPGPPLL
jgi:hypothetical protein